MELISIVGEINFEASLWHRSQSVNFSSGYESFFSSNVIQDVKYYW
jgi:hypothetical protein